MDLLHRSGEMAMSRLKLNHWQRSRLRRQLKAASDARLYRRTLAMLELDRGRSAADIADMLGVTRQSGWNAKRVIFGAMNLTTGTRLLLPRPKGRSGDYQAFLAEVRHHYRGWHVAMLLDEAPSHTAKASVRGSEGMTLLWLPNRAP